MAHTPSSDDLNDVLTRSTARPRRLWWVSPPGVVVLMVAPTLLVASRMTDQAFRVQFREPKSLTTGTTLLFLAGAMVLVAGSTLPLLRTEGSLQTSHQTLTVRQQGVLQVASTWLYRLTIFGYAAFVAVAIARGLRLSTVLSAFGRGGTRSNTLRVLFTPVTGITTLTQAGIAFVVTAVLLLQRNPDRRTRWRLLTVLLLGLSRAYLVNERLAILELVIPILAVLVLDRAGTAFGIRRVMIQAAPIVLVPLLILVFSVFEYSRSYSFYARNSHESFLHFGASRLAGYYVTAYNNGQISLDHEHFAGRLPYGTLEVVWTAPGAKQVNLYSALAGQDDVQFSNNLLARYGNPEFNSPGGLATPFLDYGIAGGFVFLFVAGVMLGFLYRKCCDGQIYAVLIYPPLVTGLYELPRYIYWTQGRVAVAVGALAIVAGRIKAAAPDGSPHARDRTL